MGNEHSQSPGSSAGRSSHVYTGESPSNSGGGRGLTSSLSFLARKKNSVESHVLSRCCERSHCRSQ